MSENRKAIGLIAIAVVIFVFYSQGTFDKVLVNVGLNAKPCYVSPLFGTRCGKEAEAIKEWKDSLDKEDTTP